MISSAVFTKFTTGAKNLPQATLLPIFPFITTPVAVTWPSKIKCTYIVYQRLIIYSIYYVNNSYPQKKEGLWGAPQYNAGINTSPNPFL